MNVCVKWTNNCMPSIIGYSLSSPSDFRLSLSTSRNFHSLSPVENPQHTHTHFQNFIDRQNKLHILDRDVHTNSVVPFSGEISYDFTSKTQGLYLALFINFLYVAF